MLLSLVSVKMKCLLWLFWSNICLQFLFSQKILSGWAGYIVTPRRSLVLNWLTCQITNFSFKLCDLTIFSPFFLGLSSCLFGDLTPSFKALQTSVIQSHLLNALFLVKQQSSILNYCDLKNFLSIFFQGLNSCLFGDLTPSFKPQWFGSHVISVKISCRRGLFPVCGGFWQRAHTLRLGICVQNPQLLTKGPFWPVFVWCSASKRHF